MCSRGWLQMNALEDYINAFTTASSRTKTLYLDNRVDSARPGNRPARPHQLTQWSNCIAAQPFTRVLVYLALQLGIYEPSGPHPPARPAPPTKLHKSQIALQHNA